ncbi:penicillin-binding transpeptidase domain-containing protein [Neofamilia massiliensis]|uniref:penicillin-binding transpeptidase domain-containing protein n=1 Tax=Neofamilia massiliensis TaxID=1673724 RepID=UPI0006BB758E|nr:penicillin-binding transpeptidase domain-containing protein [Neofamilia massiliensis]
MKKNSKINNNRIIFLLILFFIVTLAIVVRLFYLQVIDRKNLTKRAIEQINRSEEIVSDRGYILDKNGKRLAINTASSTVYFNGGQDIDSANRSLIAKELSKSLNLDELELYKKISAKKRVKIVQWVDSNVAMELREKNLAGIEIVDGFRRVYPYQTLASHVLGFTNIDGVGQYGVEASYNSNLTGSPGRIFKSSDRNNRQLPTGKSQVFEANDGLSAVLTIDQGIQKFVEDETKKIISEFQADKVHIIVEEVETGHILAMSSYPSFDPNGPTKAVSDMQAASWLTKTDEEIQKDWYDNWRNPVVSNIYEPGSTFKLITAAAAMEENTSSPEKQYYCTGYIRDIKNAPVLKCVSYKDPHGNITLRQALAKSCNPSFVYVNRDLGRESFLKYVKAFGFGEKTGIDLPGEALGIIPTSADKITELSLATMAYGHGIATTPIQLINAVAAIGNNGLLMEPRLVKELVNSNGQVIRPIEISEKRQVISKETADNMLSMMAEVVENGTASRAKSTSYSIGGKTGTANKVLEDGTGYYEDQYVASFVGLAPIEDPVIAVLVIVDNPKDQYYGSIVATPAGKNIIEYTLENLGLPKNTKIKSSEYTDLIKVPDLTNRLIGDGGSILSQMGLNYSVGYGTVTEESIITAQKPKAGEFIEKDEVVELDLDINNGERKITPNLEGKDEQELARLLEEISIDFKVEGLEGGVVVDQNPKAGEKIAQGETLTLILGEKVEDSVNPASNGLKDGLLEIENDENKKTIKSVEINDLSNKEKDKEDEDSNLDKETEGQKD